MTDQLPEDFTQKGAYIVKASKKLVDHLLSLNLNNRNVRKGHVKWLAEAINNKDFVFTNQGIGISETGQLVDGQHRLTAIREAGYPPVELLLVTGMPEKAKIYLDQNAKRSAADMLKIVLDKNITTGMAALMRLHMGITETKEGFILNRQGKPNLEKMVELMTEYQPMIEELFSNNKGKMRAGALVAIFHYALKYDVERAMEFSAKVGQGSNLKENDPAFRVREYLLNNNRRGWKLEPMQEYRLMVTACIADAQDRELQAIRGTNSWDDLPEGKPQPRRVKVGDRVPTQDLSPRPASKTA